MPYEELLDDYFYHCKYINLCQYKIYYESYFYYDKMNYEEKQLFEFIVRMIHKGRLNFRNNMQWFEAFVASVIKTRKGFEILNLSNPDLCSLIKFVLCSEMREEKLNEILNG